MNSKDRHATSWECECASGHYLRYVWWDDEDISALEGHLEITGRYFDTFPQRLKMAWRVLWWRHVDTNVGILIDWDKAVELSDAIEDFMNHYRRRAAIDERREHTEANDGQADGGVGGPRPLRSVPDGVRDPQPLHPVPEDGA